ncbi:MAG: NUDIX domain-containing protein [Firmicutes bacterium]|nr:NUDIX domain-containing protein [Bacillota bacterium]
MQKNRAYPDRPVVGVGGVVIRDDRALLIRRGSEPLKGQWSIPGGLLELGETLEEGVRRELREETGLNVRVLELIEVFERIFPEPEPGRSPSAHRPRPRYHYVILDYLCEAPEGAPRAGGDVTHVAFAAEAELDQFHLTPTALRVLRKAFAMARRRAL